MFYLNSQLVDAYHEQKLRDSLTPSPLNRLSTVTPTYWDHLLFQLGDRLVALGERVREVSAYSHVKQGCA